MHPISGKGAIPLQQHPSPHRPPRNRWLLHSGIAVTIFILVDWIVFLILRQLVSHLLPGFLIASLLGLAALLLLLALDLHTLRAVTVSIQNLTAAADRITSGTYGAQINCPQCEEFRELTEAFNRMSAQLAETETARAAFIASVSHELRTPLTAITGWSETLLYDDTLSPSAQDGLHIIAKEANRLTALAEELQRFTHVRDNQFSLTIQKTDVSDILESALLAYRELLRSAEMELVYLPCEDALPKIDADPDRLKQVFLNLLDNAVKYGKVGRRLAVATSLQEGAVRIQFRDFGLGVPEEQLSHLRTRFYRGNSNIDGTGIGLAVCDEIITRHGGTLTLANAKGGGFLVSIQLPIRL